MNKPNTLTGSELLQLAQDRGVKIGGTYLINRRTYHLCTNEDGSSFIHQIPNNDVADKQFVLP